MSDDGRSKPRGSSYLQSFLIENKICASEAKKNLGERFKFLGLDFKPVELDDQGVLQPLLRRFPQKVSGYTFATLVAWAPAYGFAWSMPTENSVLIARKTGAENLRQLLQPIGIIEDAIFGRILGEARDLPYGLQLLGVGREFIDTHRDLVHYFHIIEDRDASNYLHHARDLAELHGRKFSKKRNLITQFVDDHPNWEVADLTARCGVACAEILLAMARAENISDDSPSLKLEMDALEFTMEHFDQLEQGGIMIRAEGKAVGFSVFEPLTSEMVAVHFEKASRAVKGAFQLLNRETAKAILERGFSLINREEDLGDQGLRQAKSSYQPSEIYPVYNLTLDAQALPFSMR